MIDPDDDQGALGAVPDYPVDALPVHARELVVYGHRAGLPAELLGGGVLAALAAAVGPGARIRVTPSWHERAIVWCALMGPRGCGKTPSQELAFRPLRSHDDQVPVGAEILLGDTTIEALYRDLNQRDGAATVEIDELAVMLRGIGEYKGGASGDQARMLALWSGSPSTYTRVGGGGKTENQTAIRIPRPTVVICGGLQEAVHELLGDEATGMRPRWLPHLAEMPAGAGKLQHGHTPVDWTKLIGGQLIPARHTPRTWHLEGAALSAFETFRAAWKDQARQLETATTSAALGKADRHLARIALVIAEAENPAAAGPIPAELIHQAAAIVDYTIDVWRALPEQGGISLSRRDETLDNAIPRLIAWLGEHGGTAARRELLRAHAAGVRTATDLDQLLHRYEATHPGTVREAYPETGGPRTTIVTAPRRHTLSPLSPEKLRFP